MIEQEVNYKPLLILNASAGSGKTFNLVRYYLKLVLRTENPVPVSKILAMTFTNKASNEMKSRIMGELFKIAHAEKTQNETFLSNLDRIAKDLIEEPKAVGRNARAVLKSILHQYEDFNVLTIDKFNLRLIRSFSRDLNLSENFEVVLNEKELLEKAVDELLSSISDNNKNEVYYHAIEYAKSSLDEEKDWQIRKELIDSAKLLQKEAFRDEVEKLSKSTFNKELKEDWKTQLKALFFEFKNLQEKTKLFLSKFVETDFAGKSTTFKGINKLISELSEREFHSAKIELSEASERNILKSTISDLDKNQLLQANLDVIEIQKKATSLNLFIKNFHIMGVLAELSKRMKAICEQEGVVLISDFNQLVGNLINEEDAPFIYERIGNRFSHFFLDEFQDTSRLQWLNMIPLLHHSLSENQFSLIVGDPKQSIYRFKNGLAEQFVELPKIYNPEKNPLIESRSAWFESQGKVEALEQNWRSSQEIVSFNNSFFQEIISNTEIVPEKGQKFYSSISQEPKGDEGGYIEVQLFDKASYSNDAVQIEVLLKWVEDCLTDGFEMSDLCVLGAKTSQCNQYASALKNKGYDVISADSLLLPSDQHVQLTIDFLKCFSNTSIEQRFKLFAERFLRFKFKEKGAEIYLKCFEIIEEKKYFNHELFHQLSGISKKLFNFNYPDIYSLIKEFFREVGLTETSNAYLQQLLDFAHDFDKRNGPELTEFISYYENRGKNTNVDFVSDSNAITVM
ncbi:MAG: UvrD-helicase domain-containing protein, partial [Fluviicola sp.]